MFQLWWNDTIIFTLSVWLHKYIHQPYQTGSFHVPRVKSHMILKVTKMILNRFLPVLNYWFLKQKTPWIYSFCSSFQKIPFSTPPPPSPTEWALCPPRRHMACSTACCWTVCIIYLFKKHHLICTLDPPLRRALYLHLAPAAYISIMLLRPVKKSS